jgi:precorrin-6A/cobalt-precorrin-6A reductase
MTRTRVLTLGGTSEARLLAAALERDSSVTVISSLAGRVAEPRLPPGRTRVGGFGGVDGLAGWLVDEQIDLLIDATHPFAATMSIAADSAARRVGVPLLRLSRPEWRAGPADRWHQVDSVREAAQLLPDLGSRVFLTTGRQGLAEFAHLDELWFLVRTIDPPAPPVPRAKELLLGRGPFSEHSERDLMLRYEIEVVVTKNSGGDATAAKLAAARSLGLPVVMVSRPRAPGGVTTVESVDAALEWVAGYQSGRPG